MTTGSRAPVPLLSATCAGLLDLDARNPHCVKSLRAQLLLTNSTARARSDTKSLSPQRPPSLTKPYCHTTQQKRIVPRFTFPLHACPTPKSCIPKDFRENWVKKTKTKSGKRSTTILPAEHTQNYVCCYLRSGETLLSFMPGRVLPAACRAPAPA